MAMYPCKKCLNNKWKYKYDDGLIIATCQQCGDVVKFQAKKKSEEQKKKAHIVGIWKMQDNKQFKLIDNNWEEMKIYEGYDEKGKWFMQIIPLT